MTEEQEELIKHLGLGVRTISAGWQTLAGMVVLPLAALLLRLTQAEQIIMAYTSVPVALVGIAVLVPIREVTLKKLRTFLVKNFEGEATEKDYRQGFARLVNLPRQEAALGLGLWLSLAPPIVVALWWLSDTFSAGQGAIVCIAAVAAGIISQIFSFVSIKQFLEPYRMIAAEHLPDPAVRRKLVKPVPIRFKLSVVISSLIIVVTFCSVVFTQARSMSLIEKRETKGQRALVEALQDDAVRVLAGEEAALEPRPVQTYFGEGNFLIVDGETGAVVSGDERVMMGDEINAMVAQLRSDKRKGIYAGDSSAFNTPNTFSWKELPDQKHVLVVVTTHEADEEKSDAAAYIVLVAVLSVGLGLATANSLTGDVKKSLVQLNAQVETITSGDLRRATVLESEDDFGNLARGIEQMSLALRDTVANVVESADSVDRAAEEIASVSGEVASASTDQANSVSSVTAAMESINQQVEGISESAIQLNASVEESSASVLQLGTMGGQLTESSDVLATRVEEVSRTFGTMFQDIDSVMQSADIVTQGTQETAGGVKEMAAALSEVDSNATETLKLSEDVVDSAEGGQVSVEKTMRGIDSIREDRTLVTQMVRDLGEQSDQIGSIVGVITNVADETNLLALNAAIIAAQAGEHGRSFSVVADEIKDLADRVLASASEITKVIQDVQGGANKAVNAIERGEESVQTGVALAQESGSSLEAITSAARESGGRMQEVVRAVQEQSAAAEQVSRLMESMRQGVENIQHAARQQSERTHEVVASNDAMRDAAAHVRTASEEQGYSAREISSTIEHVQDATLGIVEALQQQSEAIQEVARLMEFVNEKTQSNEASTRRMTESVSTLSQEASRLREGVKTFKI